MKSCLDPVGRLEMSVKSCLDRVGRLEMSVKSCLDRVGRLEMSVKSCLDPVGRGNVGKVLFGPSRSHSDLNLLSHELGVEFTNTGRILDKDLNCKRITWRIFIPHFKLLMNA